MANIYNVKNRSASVVVYRIPEDNVRREFAPGESKKISFQELERLTYQPGGRAILANFLQVIDDEVINELNIPVENEYYMTEEQVIELMKTGSYDAFLDCLDYAPVGIIDLIKKFAVSLPLNDIQKAEALKAKTGFDVHKALENAAADATPEVPGEATAAPAPSGRRINTNYKVVNTKSVETKENAQ